MALGLLSAKVRRQPSWSQREDEDEDEDEGAGRNAATDEHEQEQERQGHTPPHSHRLENSFHILRVSQTGS